MFTHGKEIEQALNERLLELAGKEIANVSYHPQRKTRTMICLITLHNGYTSSGRVDTIGSEAADMLSAREQAMLRLIEIKRYQVLDDMFNEQKADD